MEEEDKLSGIETYLKELFPQCAIANMRDSESGSYSFRVHARLDRKDG